MLGCQGSRYLQSPFPKDPTIVRPPRNRFRAATVRERPWTSRPTQGMKPMGFQRSGRGATVAPDTWPVTNVPGSVPCSRTPFAMPDSEPRTPVSGHGVRPSLCNQALVFGRENADHVISGDDAAEFSLFIHNRQGEQIVLVEQLDDALAVGVETNLNRLSKRPLFQGRP